MSATTEFVTLDPFVHQRMRWCSKCGGQQIFLPIFEFEGGRIGVCLGCGDEQIAPFTRATGEAA